MTGHAEPASGNKALLHHVWHAVTSGLTGYIFSVLLSAVIVFGLYHQAQPFKTLERAGIDASFRLMSLNPNLKSHEETPQAQSSVKFRFIDVDKATCLKFSVDPLLCATQNPVQLTMLKRFSSALLSTSASIVLLDTQLDLNKPDERVFIESLMDTSAKTPDSPWIIVPLLVRPVNPDKTAMKGEKAASAQLQAINPLWFDEDWRTAHSFYASKVRFALFGVMTDTEAGDGLIRNYPTHASVRISQSAQNAIVPSAAQLVSHLYNAQNGQKNDCAYFDISCRPTLKSKDNPASESTLRRIIYTLPALSQQDGSGQHNLKFRAIYSHALASQLMDGDEIRYAKDWVDHAVIIIGSSLPSASDVHLTPVGLMSGSEVILNASRSDMLISRETGQVDAGVRRSHFSQSLALFNEKAGAALLPSFIVLASYLLSGLVIWVATKYLNFWHKSTWPSLIVTSIFFATSITICIYIEIVNNTNEIYENIKRGEVTDILTPMLALGIEVYTELVSKLLKFIETAIERVGAVLARLIQIFLQSLKR